MISVYDHLCRASSALKLGCCDFALNSHLLMCLSDSTVLLHHLCLPPLSPLCYHEHTILTLSVQISESKRENPLS